MAKQRRKRTGNRPKFGTHGYMANLGIQRGSIADERHESDQYFWWSTVEHLYGRLTVEQRRQALHPKHLHDWWLSWNVRLIDDDAATIPDFVRPAGAIPDTGPAPQITGIVRVEINVNASPQATAKNVKALIDYLRPHAKKATELPGRQRYTRDDIQQMIVWYYRLAAGESLKVLASELIRKKPSATATDHAHAQRQIQRRLIWLKSQLGLRSS